VGVKFETVRKRLADELVNDKSFGVVDHCLDNLELKSERLAV
jgi:hypothetical protein